ncbi:MAG: Gfo/Idh/MocA family oxidoreductase [Gemmatimonadota bacterium]
MAGKAMKVGVVGCGNISAAYLKIAKRFESIEVTAVADLVAERARARAQEFEVPRDCTVAELLADPQIEIVLNLTIPKAHAEVAFAALEAGKHVYNEKPLAVSRQDGARMLELAAKKGRRVGGAPDTFMGAGLQTCRKLIDDGWIGQPIGAAAFFLNHGHEHWHPDPAFYYQPGGGPMFDMGPYYLTALVALMGPVKRVTGATRVTFPERTITSQAKYGEKIAVGVPTHIAGIMEFASGAVGTITTSFDVWACELPRIEIYGTAGSLSAPDPNGFGGPVRLRRAGAEAWSEVPLTHGNADNSRSIGVADMACAIRSGRPHRASGELTFHVLDLMHAFHEAAAQAKHVGLTSTCPQPAPLPLGLLPGRLDP